MIVPLKQLKIFNLQTALHGDTGANAFISSR